MKTGFERFGTMIDCSRNAVARVETVEKWIDLTADLGFNVLSLYMEDTYEIPEEPYFGYMRGRYSQDELRRIDDYAWQKGMEVIPCIQTLAHLNALVRWKVYAPHVDTSDILLTGDERVYMLIDRMFASLAVCFRSRTVNIGMDEAHLIGRGAYYDQNGDRDRFDILLEHLQRVSAIGRKYGFQLLMWSDMFFRLASGGDYYNTDVAFRADIREKIPDNVKLVYWDYYPNEIEHFRQMLSCHQKLDSDIWYAGGLWNWNGFSAQNRYAMNAVGNPVRCCLSEQVKNVLITTWGDDGGECSIFAVLPALFYVSELAKGNTDPVSIRVCFREKYQMDFDDFLLLDLAGKPDTAIPGETVSSAEKCYLYNDCFMGLLDGMLCGDENAYYTQCAEQIARMTADEQWGYLFETQRTLCEVLSIKAELGKKTHEVYALKDKSALAALIEEYGALLVRLRNFRTAFRSQWMKENKPHGFDVQDIRLGGVSARVESCMERLQALYDGEIDCIEELEEKQLDFCCGENVKKRSDMFRWLQLASANVF